MDGLPIITADEMKRVEDLAFASGESDREYMFKAGNGIAARIEKFLIAPASSGEILLLIGKGNNGGDAFVVGRILMLAGYDVSAHMLAPMEECSPLSQEMGKMFLEAGGKATVLTTPPDFPEKGLIVDALVGTGFRGDAKGLLAEVIKEANRSPLTCFAIDIPSGLNGNTGEVGSIAVQADETIYLGLPKLGFFIGKGWTHIGRLTRVDFGMPEKFILEAHASAHLFGKEQAVQSLPPIARDRHKYQAGYVVAVAGSPGMSGAAIMATMASLKAGAGICRLFYPEGMEGELQSAPFELISESWDEEDASRILCEQKRASALLLGPGMGRTEKAAAALKIVLEGATVPVVLDADALFLLAQDPALPLPEKVVLTPHFGEMERLLGAPPTFETCAEYAAERKATLILKGAPTAVFHPNTTPLVIPRGDPGMATAGAGDVLTGVVAALLAQKVDPRRAAALAVYLHATAGEIAAEYETSYSVIATDILQHLPDAFQSLLE